MVQKQTACRQVADRLRARIIEGYWQPGERLPVRRILARELDSSQATVQEAVFLLADEGFLELGARKHGTRVAEFLPHQCRYRLVFPHGPDHWGQFWHALESVVAEKSSDSQEYQCFYGLEGHRSISDYNELVDEVRTKRIAGLIFASSADEFTGTPLLEAPGIPRVAIANENVLPGIPKVCLDLDDFCRRAAESLISRGCRKIGILSKDEFFSETFRVLLSEAGLATNPIREQFAPLDLPIAVERVVQLMMSVDASERPDGLILTDDNFISAATQGLVEEGIDVPHDLSIVAMTNYPNLVPASVPVHRIGFDVGEVLDLLTTRLQQVIAGEDPSEFTLIKSRQI